MTLAQQADAWRAKWPDHCTKCGGTGGVDHWQQHDGPGYEHLFETCACVDEGKCSRCGAGYNYPEPCPVCGWSFDDACPDDETE
jgi:hypothetical protein